MISEGQLLFAPMEGVTNSLYREVVTELYPEWDFFACDFLRIPTTVAFPRKHILKHFGKKHFDSPIKDKTIFQVLTSENGKTKETFKDLKDLGFKWVDLNLGCPSKTVVKNKGGSYLLKAPHILDRILGEIRETYEGFFSVKIRVGFEDDSVFEDNLRLFEKHQVGAITIHGRTREELYKGKANWDYLKRASEMLDIPIIGNGDIWTLNDISSCFSYTKNTSLMIARGALKRPWLASHYYQNIKETDQIRIKEIKRYLYKIHDVYVENNMPNEKILRFLKGLVRYIFDDLPNDEVLKRTCLRSLDLKTFFKTIDSIH